MAGRVHASHNYCLVSSQSKCLACAPGLQSRCAAPARARVCTPLQTCPVPDKPRPLALLLSVPCSSLGPGSFIPLPSNFLCSPSAGYSPETSRQVSTSPFWVFQEGGEEENTSVNSLFLGCLMKRDKTAEELRAGVWAPTPSFLVLPLPAELRQRLLPTPPPSSRCWAPTGGSASGQSPGRLLVQRAALPSPSTQPEFSGIDGDPAAP